MLLTPVSGRSKLTVVDATIGSNGTDVTSQQMSLTHSFNEALDVVIERLSLCSIVRLCTVSASCRRLCLQLLSRQPSRIQQLLLEQVQRAATLHVEPTNSPVGKRRIQFLADKQNKRVAAAQWLMRAQTEDHVLVPSSLVADNPEFTRHLFQVRNVPADMATALVQDADIRISHQQLMTGVESRVEGIEVWVTALRASGQQSDLPAWTEVICCNDASYLESLPLPSRAAVLPDLLNLAINCKSSIAMQLLAKQTTIDWQRQLSAAALQDIYLTTIRRGHDPAILQRLLMIRPADTDTITAALRLELQGIASGNWVFSSRGDLRRLKYMPTLLEQEAAHRLGPDIVSEVAQATSRMTDWPILMLDYVCGLPAMQQLSGPMLYRLLATGVQRCKSPRCDILLELEVLHALCQLHATRQLEHRMVADLMLQAEDIGDAAVAALLCHYLNPQHTPHAQVNPHPGTAGGDGSVAHQGS